jgi:hypothetical protein
LQAESATICIAHTKNGTKGAVVHHSRGRGSICPVAALARRVANIQAGPARGNINLVYTTGGRISRVTDRDVGLAVRWGAASDQLLARGYTMDRVSSHSLRAGGAMAMKLSGASDSTIMRVGRWSSLTYLTYIHSQIGALTAGVGMEHVESVQVPECWVINRVCQRNKVRRQHCHTGNHCWMLGAPVSVFPGKQETGSCQHTNMGFRSGPWPRFTNELG